MSAPRRSSSPLSSATPSPVHAPTANGFAAPTKLSLGAAADLAREERPDHVGGSSQTSLTDPLTESELTEDEEDEVDPEEDVDGDVDTGDAADDEAVDGGDDTELPSKRPSDSRGSLSPSLTPPPPSDPPRSEQLPSSPLANEGEAGDDDEAMDQEDPEAEEGAAELDADDAEDEQLTAEPPTPVNDDDEDADLDADVTMRAEDADDAPDALNEMEMEAEAADAEAEEVEDEAEAEAEAEAADADAEDADPDADPEAAAENDAEAEEEEAEDDTDSPATLPSRSQHAPPPTPEAMRALLALEVKFASLRDRLYVERLEEAAREEQMILDGTHPALNELNKIIETRRERLHEIALRRFEESLNDLAIWRDVEKKLSWSTWADQRDQIHWEEFEHTWSKRRRLAREKNELETPKVHKPVPRADKPTRPFDWSAGAVPQKLSTEEALSDLQLMDLRRQQQQQASRHQSPALYSNYAGPSSAAYSYQAQHPASYLQAETEPERRQYNPPPRQPHRPTSQPEPRPVAGPSIARKPQPFGVPRREGPIPTNGDHKTNGHRPPQNALGLGLTPHPAKDTKPSSAALTATSQPNERVNASSRFPGLADYLSGSATPPQNSFQHHLQSNSSTPAKPPAPSSSLGVLGGLAAKAALTSGRPSFAAAPQPQTASVPRS